MSRITWIIVPLALAGCISASEQPAPVRAEIAPPKPDKPGPITIARDYWLACVRRSFASQIGPGTEKGVAVERAFDACRTEENAITALFPSDPNGFIQLTQTLAV